jgi:hypothetical protein
MTDWGFFVLPASLFFNGLAHLFVTLPFLFFVISTQGEIYLTATVCHPPSVFFAYLWKASAPLLRMTCPMSRTVECAPMYNGFSKIEIPSRPLPTGCRCEGMTDWGFLICRPHSFSMASPTLFVTLPFLFFSSRRRGILPDYCRLDPPSSRCCSTDQENASQAARNDYCIAWKL